MLHSLNDGEHKKSTPRKVQLKKPITEAVAILFIRLRRRNKALLIRMHSGQFIAIKMLVIACIL